MADELTTTLDSAYGKRLRDLRDSSGRTQADVVDALNSRGIRHMNATTLSRIEAGARPVRLSEAKAFADIYGWTLAALAAQDDEFELIEQARRSEHQARMQLAEFREGVVELFERQRALVRSNESLARLLETTEVGSDLRDDLTSLKRDVDELIAVDPAVEAASLIGVLGEQAESEAGQYLSSRTGRDHGKHQAAG